MIDRRLQTLRAVKRWGTVTAAAEAFHLTPSAASQQLRQLSADLGVALLEPHGRNVRLTDAAVRLVDHADALFARWEEARADLARRGDTTAGTLRICESPTAVARLVAPAAARLQTTCPELSVRVSEVETDEGFDLLLADEADIAVVAPTPSSPPPSDPRFDRVHPGDRPPRQGVGCRVRPRGPRPRGGARSAARHHPARRPGRPCPDQRPTAAGAAHRHLRARR